MQKTLIWLVCLLFNITYGIGQPIPLENNPGDSDLDSTRFIKLIYDAKKKEAASFLNVFLNQQSDKDSKELAGTWLELAVLLAWSDQAEASRQAYDIYLKVSAGKTENLLIRSNRLLYQSLKLSSLEALNQAADSLVASISFRPDSGELNRIMLADSYGKLARLYKKTGDLFESSRNFERSISLNRKLARASILADDLTEMSSVISTMDSRDQRADQVLLESLSIYTTTDSLPAEAQVLNELGVLFNRRGNFRESLRYFKQSLNVKARIPGLSKSEFIAVINNIGHCYQYLDNTDSARLFFQKAVDYAVLSGSNPARYYANLGANYGGKEEYSKAIEYFQKALNCLDPTCSLTDLSTNPRVIKVTPQLAEFTAYKAHSYHRRYNQLRKPDDLVNGLKTFMVALEMMDTLRFLYSFESKPYLSSEAKIHFFSALDMALDLYQITGERRYLDQAFQLSERNKSATLNEFLRTNLAREYMGNVAPWISHEDSVKQLINKIESKLIRLTSEPNPPADSLAALQTRISDLTDELKNIGIAARRENPAYFQMVYSNHSYLPQDIQKLINPGEALIDYTVVRDFRLSQDYMVIMVLTHDTLFTFRDTLPDQFREDIAAFRASITSYVDAKVFQEFSRFANVMYEYFFAPIEKFKGITKLIILPDEELGFLPFGAFVSDTLKPKGSDFRKLSYLNRKYQISYISSHEQFYQFRSNPGIKTKSTIYAFAPFAGQGARLDTLNLSPLENSGKEIRFISKYFRTKIFIDKQAGEQALRRAFQRTSVVTLSTHGIMNPSQPMQSRLLLNPSEPDGSLYLFEMLSLKIRSTLVVLNACNTGTGKLQVGEGIMSMARGFQIAGVPSVITTLWPVDDQSSSSIMKLFFKNLFEGMDQREALMKAQNSFIDQATKATGAPYFWAGQVLIGNPGNLLIFHHRNPLLILAPLLLIGIILGLFLLVHKKAR